VVSGGKAEVTACELLSAGVTLNPMLGKESRLLLVT
jgi:hypothetical protein